MSCGRVWEAGKETISWRELTTIKIEALIQNKEEPMKKHRLAAILLPVVGSLAAMFATEQETMTAGQGGDAKRPAEVVLDLVTANLFHQRLEKLCVSPMLQVTYDGPLGR